MKRLLLTAVLGVVHALVFAQGTINFANGGPGLVAMVYDTDGATPLVGSAWSADLYWAPGVITDSTLLSALNQPATFSTVPQSAGLFFGGARTILGAAPGTTITAQIRVWDTASGGSWAAASAVNGARIGESVLSQVIPVDPLSPAVPFTVLTGLNGHSWNVHLVPEPSTLALAGVGVVVFLRRCLTNR
jgi:hypothetical protein